MRSGVQSYGRERAVALGDHGQKANAIRHALCGELGERQDKDARSHEPDPSSRSHAALIEHGDERTLVAKE